MSSKALAQYCTWLQGDNVRHESGRSSRLQKLACGQRRNDKSLVVTRFLFVWPKGIKVNLLAWQSGMPDPNYNVLANDLLKEIPENMYVDASEDASPTHEVISLDSD